MKPLLALGWKNSMANPRLLAAQALTAVLCHQGSLASSLPKALEAAEHGDRALIQQL